MQKTTTLIFKRKEYVRVELLKRARSKINKEKYYGIKTEIEGYRKEIFDVFYNEELLNKNLGSEQLDLLNDYFEVINSKIKDLLEKAREYISKSFDKGTRRVIKQNGDTVKFGEVKDKSAIDNLVNKQARYYQNLSKAQSRKVNSLIAIGLEKKLPFEEVANLIRSEIKNLTYNRALNISRTELVRAHNKGQVELLKQAGADKYLFVTSGDSKVCKICKGIQADCNKKGGYLVSEAGSFGNFLPVENTHPNCRCTIVIK